MKKIKTFALMMGIALTGTAGFTACSSSNVEEEINPNVVIGEDGKAAVKPEFVISVPRTVVRATRMDGDVTQNDGTYNQFRGLDNIRLIPFGTEPTSASNKLADVMRLSPIQSLKVTPNINYKVYTDQLVPVGTSNFLFYGKAVDAAAEAAITSMSDKFNYGILNYTGLDNDDFTTPGDIVFSLEPINTSTERQAGDATGKRIVALLNNIANTTVSGVEEPHDKWSTTTDATMAGLYKNFIRITVSSSKSLAVILSRVYFSLDHIQSTSPAIKLANAIKTKINDVCATPPTNGSPVSLLSSYNGYPGNIGLPDGAARVQWNASGSEPNSFTDITANYGNGNTVDITKYTYPAALWYYANTPLKASTEKESDDYDTAGNWDGVINSVYAGAATVVDADTKSVALTNPVQYGVGRLETAIKMGSGTFYDRNGEVIAIGDYKLTGLLIGGQSSVNFDFTQRGNENLTIYDRVMAGDIVARPNSLTANVNQTLALETKKDQKIYVALELQNGGEDFMGADGIIPAGGTFYLTAELDPTKASNYDPSTRNKIFIQDHVTQLTVTIKNGKSKDDPTFDPENPDGGGLGEATNGIPDLTSPGIEVGTSVDLQWRQGLIINPEI
jgi:hypothetical protein